jgi:hypothetical protein
LFFVIGSRFAAENTRVEAYHDCASSKYGQPDKKGNGTILQSETSNSAVGYRSLMTFDEDSWRQGESGNISFCISVFTLRPQSSKTKMKVMSAIQIDFNIRVDWSADFTGSTMIDSDQYTYDEVFRFAVDSCLCDDSYRCLRAVPTFLPGQTLRVCLEVMQKEQVEIEKALWFDLQQDEVGTIRHAIDRNGKPDVITSVQYISSVPGETTQDKAIMTTALDQQFFNALVPVMLEGAVSLRLKGSTKDVKKVRGLFAAQDLARGPSQSGASRAEEEFAFQVNLSDSAILAGTPSADASSSVDRPVVVLLSCMVVVLLLVLLATQIVRHQREDKRKNRRWQEYFQFDSVKTIDASEMGVSSRQCY